MRFSDAMAEAASRLLDACTERGLRIVTAESCTGGLLAGCLTAITGSSHGFERGFVTYSNDAKTEELDVPPALIREKGAVSAEVARAMAEGALAHSRADLAASLTGVAGPDGGTPEKPVGLVWIGIARRDRGVTAHRCLFSGDRAEIRQASVERAIELLSQAVASD
ncbi:MAG TPA: CinA family protein [Alphaproteobacteria bacterium]|nr:CinA family protein [Alphaproteobacteria bacterium]